MNLLHRHLTGFLIDVVTKLDLVMLQKLYAPFTAHLLTSLRILYQLNCRHCKKQNKTLLPSTEPYPLMSLVRYGYILSFITTNSLACSQFFSPSPKTSARASYLLLCESQLPAQASVAL